MSASQGDRDDASESLHQPSEMPTPTGHCWPLIEILPVGVFTLDAGNAVQAMNAAAAGLVGHPTSEVVGMQCREVMACTYCSSSCSTHQARETGRPSLAYPAEMNPPGDAPARSILIDAVPLEDGGVAVLLRDASESERIRKALKDRWVFHGLVCVSAAMKEIVDQVRDVAPYDSTVLIRGESGTGKELVARALHAESPRASKPFVVVNCSAYSESLLESELFGHVRGAFTGADRDRRGRFELADGGTVLLGEIGRISPKLQIKLLRLLQECEIERVGESRPRQVNVRVLASTNRDLHREVREGRFREDLYYRLNVFALELPPLRDRKEDIPALADHLMERLAERTGKSVRGLSNQVLEALLRHGWQGNVRELENVLECAVVRAQGDFITAIDLPLGAAEREVAEPGDRMREALKRAGGCVTRAARLMGVHRTTLWRRMRESGLRREDFLQG